MSYASAWVEEIIHGVPEGSRHDSAVRLVGRWYGKRLCRQEILFLLVIWNQLNSPPLPAQELESIIQSTTDWEYPRNSYQMTGEYSNSKVEIIKKHFFPRTQNK